MSAWMLTPMAAAVSHLGCEDCTNARVKVWGGMRWGCVGCEARRLSRTPLFAESRKAGRLAPAYLEALRSAGLTHDLVKKARASDFEGRDRS
jgi:hypothetical protein